MTYDRGECHAAPSAYISTFEVPVMKYLPSSQRFCQKIDFWQNSWSDHKKASFFITSYYVTDIWIFTAINTENSEGHDNQAGIKHYTIILESNIEQ